MKRLLTFSFLVTFTFTSFAQGTRIWSTYYGNTGGDGEGAVATDASGNVYLAGSTSSTTGISSGGFQNVYGGGGGDVFLVKFDQNGNRIWATYYGGTGDESTRGIAIDASGNIYLSGSTTSTSSISSGGFQNTYGGGANDAFLVKFSPAGARIWATYYGGALDDQCWGVDVDPAGNVYIGGNTLSTTSIASGGFQNAIAGGWDAFLVKFSSAGARIWGTYYGGTLEDKSWGLATDASNNVYLGGYTKSTTGIASGGFQNVYGGNPYDAYLVKFDASGNRLWGTYYGSTGDDRSSSVATDPAGNVYIGGQTSSATGISSGGFQNTFGGGTWDCILVKFNTAGNRIWATYYGGGGSDWGTGVHADVFGNIYLSGVTASGANISSSGAQNAYGGGFYDSFLADFNTNGTRMCATYLGGSAIEYTYDKSISTDPSGNVYLIGYTTSTNNIASGGFQNTSGGSSDAFLAKYISCNVPLSITALSTNILCNGNCNGTASSNPAGGTSPYTYLWTGGQTTQNATGLCAGSYTVTVTDAALNTSTAVVTITQPTVLTSSISSQVNLNCNGTSTGSATVTANGGTSPYIYLWSPSGGTNSNAIGLGAGNYSCTLTDANGCTSQQTLTITQPPVITGVTISSPDSCNLANGTASVSASGGTGTLTYAWSPSGGTNSTSSGLVSGNYSVTITDANGCTQVSTITVGAIVCQSSSCCSWVRKADFGGVPRWGVATFAIGTKGYIGTGDDGTQHNDFWAWDQTTNVWTQIANFGGTARYYAVGFAIGNKGYVGTGHDITNNYKNDFWEYDPATNIWTQKTNFPGAPRLDATGFSIGNKGYLGLGDNPTYFNDFYAFDPATNTWTAIASFAGTARAAAEGFSIGTKGYVTCGWDVTSNYKKDLWEYDQATNAWVQKANLPGNARVDAVAFSMNNKGYVGTGLSPIGYEGDFYEYDPASNSWGQICDFGGTARWGAKGFSIGSNCYLGVGIDANGYNQELWELSVGTINASLSAGPTICSGNSATLTASGGASYSWSTGATTSTITVSPTTTTTYSCIVANGSCADTATSIVTVNPTPVASVTGNNIICGGSSTTITASGGGNYSWSNTSTTAVITVSPTITTTYSVIVSQGSCADTSQITITVNASPTATITGTDISCNGNTDGTALANASGGTSPYTYAWSNSQTGANATGLSQGNYTVTVTDANGCSGTQIVTINQPNAVTAAITSGSTSCGNSNGTGTVTASGGTGTLTYAWSPSGGTNANATGLAAGNYTCVITDANGCSVTVTTTIAPSSLPSLALQSQTDNLCNGASTGTAVMNATGGNGPYVYSWAPSGGTNANATGLPAGTYSCFVSDASGCTQMQTVTITEPTAIAVNTNSTPALCDGTLGTATASASNGTAPYTYSWNDGQTSSVAAALSSGSYTVTITDANGCTQSQTVIVSQQTGPSATASASVTTIQVGQNSQLNATGGGTYSWYPSTGLNCTTCANPIATPNQTTTYCVQVTDVNGCTDVSCVTIDVDIPCVIQSLATLLPNAFSPNNDASNDKYCVPSNACVLSFVLTVYDRWGEKVFESSSLDDCWDGTYKGRELNTDVFVYYFNATLSNGEGFSQKGNISLVK